jgi:hypothetical protein
LIRRVVALGNDARVSAPKEAVKRAKEMLGAVLAAHDGAAPGPVAEKPKPPSKSKASKRAPARAARGSR